MNRLFRTKIEGWLREGRRLERNQRERIEGARARLESSMNMEKPDRIPVTLGISPVWSNWYFKMKYRVKIGKFWQSPKLLVEYQLRTWIDSFKDFDDDRTYVIPGEVGPLGGVVLHPSIVGCRVIFPEDDFAWIDLSHKVFDTEEKIDDFETPEITEAGLMPETLSRLEAIERLVGDLLDVRIQGGDGGPLQMATYTRGIQQLIRDMYTDPPLVHKLMRKMLKVYEGIHRYYKQTWGIRYRGEDLDGYFYDNPLSYFSPQLVEEFVLPYYRDYAQRCGWRHWSMETQDVMDQFIDIFKTIPIRSLRNLVSTADLPAFRDILGPKGVRFSVFLAPGRLVHLPSIDSQVRNVVEAMGLRGGWTLSSGVLDAAVPKDNVQTFLRSVKVHGNCR